MVFLEKSSQTVIASLLLVLGWLYASAGATESSAAGAAPANVLSPPLSDLERRLVAEIRDGRFGRFSLLEAGLIAGGVDRDEELKKYRRRFDSLAEDLRRSGKVRGLPREQIRAAFEYLHRELLVGGYCLQASDLRQAFDRGRYNCVTATVLLNCLARRFGMNAVAVEVPGHTFSRVELSDETLEIETTCPQWFSTFAAPAAGAMPRVPDTRRPRRLSDVELAATIYYNRGVDLLAERRYAEAVAANAKALRLDPNNATAKGNYVATINNWAIDLATAGQYAQAAKLFRLGMAAHPDFEAFRANYAHLLRQWDAAGHEKPPLN